MGKELLKIKEDNLSSAFVVCSFRDYSKKKAVTWEYRRKYKSDKYSDKQCRRDLAVLGKDNAKIYNLIKQTLFRHGVVKHDPLRLNESTKPKAKKLVFGENMSDGFLSSLKPGMIEKYPPKNSYFLKQCFSDYAWNFINTGEDPNGIFSWCPLIESDPQWFTKTHFNILLIDIWHVFLTATKTPLHSRERFSHFNDKEILGFSLSLVASDNGLKIQNFSNDHVAVAWLGKKIKYGLRRSYGQRNNRKILKQLANNPTLNVVYRPSGKVDLVVSETTEEKLPVYEHRVVAKERRENTLSEMVKDADFVVGIDGNSNNIAISVASLHTGEIVETMVIEAIDKIKEIEKLEKKKARLQRRLKRENGTDKSKRTLRIDEKIKNTKKTFQHVIATRVVRLVRKYNKVTKVGAVVIGKGGNRSSGMKGNGAMRKFGLAKIKDYMVQKLMEDGVFVQVCNEAYTSLASFIDGDKPEKLPEGLTFSGKRVKLEYTTKDGHVVHADVNGASNILVKWGLLEARKRDGKELTLLQNPVIMRIK